MLDWLPHDRAVRGIVGALAIGLLVLVGDAVGRSIYAIRRYGFRLWITSVFTMEPEQFRIIAVLILLVVAVTLVWLS